jgi:hypothetical protein
MGDIRKRHKIEVGKPEGKRKRWETSSLVELPKMDRAPWSGIVINLGIL